MKRNLPYSIFGWCLLILVASFMPWATGPIPFPFQLLGSITTMVNGWSGNTMILSVIVPNWIAVVIAALLATIGWLRANDVEIAPKTSGWLAVCGLVHSLFFIFNVVTAHGANIGLGAIVTFVAYVVLLRTLLKREVRTATSVSPAQTITS